MNYLYIWLGIINLIAVFLTVKDKRAAVHKRQRTPEKTLLTTAVLGGSVAMFVTMLLIRHKTKKTKFMIGIPCILFLQAVLVSWVYHTYMV